MLSCCLTEIGVKVVQFPGVHHAWRVHWDLVHQNLSSILFWVHLIFSAAAVIMVGLVWVILLLVHYCCVDGITGRLSGLGFGISYLEKKEVRTRLREEDLLELQDQNLASTMRKQQLRALEFWEKNWHSAVPLKIKRLAREPERFIWAVSMAQSQCINLQTRIGALVQNSNMLIPYADMLNHSFQPNCFFHWRFKDRMLEVMINAGQRIKK